MARFLNGPVGSVRFNPNNVKLMWSGSTDVIASTGTSEITFLANGAMICNCNDYKNSAFALERHMRTDHTFNGFAKAVYCPHVVNAQENLVNVLSSRLAVFSDGNFFPSPQHGWTFSIDHNPVSYMLPIEVLMWRARPAASGRQIDCLKYKCLVSPLDGTDGKLWNVYWSFDNPLSHIIHVHAHDHWEDGLHIGFYDDDTTFMQIGKLVASKFVDIALAAPCQSCGCVIDPEVLEKSGGRWSAIYRGHYLETHRGMCPSCDESELVPVMPDDPWDKK